MNSRYGYMQPSHVPYRHIVYEPNNPYIMVELPEVHVGDTIVYMTDNQLGYAVYSVVSDSSGGKALRQTEDIYGEL